jgi:hypothetical protein
MVVVFLVLSCSELFTPYPSISGLDLKGLNPDPVPFLQLYDRIPVAIKHILCETPRLLSAEDLVRAGCPLRMLTGKGRCSSAELLSEFRHNYSSCCRLETVKIQKRSTCHPACSLAIPLSVPTVAPEGWRILAVEDGKDGSRHM